ncbi:MAG: ABC transporter ATP-binding protein/permease [Rhodospirillales bacterium]|nr:ABC transporter ATP-binding protein/permease [Rhodospirillales bacterium]
MRALGSFLRDVWRLARPYFRSEEKWSAWGLLASIIALNLAMVGMNVVLNFWNREFFNSLQAKDWQQFIRLLFLYRSGPGGFMPGFCEIVAVYILVFVYATYLNQWLQIRWRRWLTRHYLDEWLAGRAYYRISLEKADHSTDNPDQRIAEDIRDFVATTLSLGVDFLSNIVTLLSFIGILWTLSGPLSFLGISIPGYMVWVALAYAILGTWLTHLVGRALIPLRFRQQQVEANFRFALVRLRENTEGVALYGGEAEEKANLVERFAALMANWWQIMRQTKRLNALVSGYGQLAAIFPIVVAAPRYFAGQLKLGGLTQTADAFGQVQGALSWFVQAYGTLAQWRAIVDRLTGFERAIAATRGGGAITAETGQDGALVLHDLALALPNGETLLAPTRLSLPRGVSVVVTGRSGSGKSTLFRALAGIWPFGAGSVRRPAGTLMFLPQRPYIPLGTLRHVLAYPAADDAFDDAALGAVLAEVGLARLATRLEETENWAQTLSGGEQQRIAIARALLSRPDWLFLDEATASLDPEAETMLYRLLRERLPATTLISIAHRPSVAAFHDRALVFSRSGDGPGQLLARDPTAVAGE